MADIAQLLVAALSETHITDGLRSVLESPLDPASRGKFCSTCMFLDILMSLFENSMQSEFRNGMQSIISQHADVIRDVDLGNRSDLLKRSANCLTCKTFLSYADELAGAYDENEPDLAADCMFSAHLMDDNPVLGIAFSSSFVMPASERRALLDQIPTVWLFSTNENLSINPEKWLAGKPRIFDPEQVDPAQIRGWIECCQRSHGKRCKPDSAAFSIRSKVSPSFIDVERQCVVKPADEVPYVALSYVWGPVETLQATKANISNLSRPGSLSSWSTNTVPATIRDAMKLCALVGQRYLWVDRVCIVQDDYESKRQHLEAMADTYAKAEFTIVAADGSHADYGLSGLGRRTEQRGRYGVPFPSKVMIRGTARAARRKKLAQKTWSTRAWTFQEHVFSRRLLYMDTIMSWFCYSATWDEPWSLPPATPSEEAEGLDQHGKGDKLFAIGWPSLDEYATMVEQYNSRQLTFDSDVLNAFLGIMTQMCEGFPAGFYGGLTEFYFTTCLLWQPAEGLRPRLPQNGSAPSWSWLGWSGSLDLTMWRNNTDAQLPHHDIETTITPLIKFFKKESREDKFSSCVDDTFHVVRNHFTTNADVRVPDRWQKHEGDSESNFEPFYTYMGYYGPSHIDTTRRFRYPVPPFQRPRDINPIEGEEQKLCFTTPRAFFTFGTPDERAPWRYSEHKDGRYYAVDVPIYTAAGKWAGSIRINAHEAEKIPTGEKAELIRIAKGSVPMQGRSSSLQYGAAPTIRSQEPLRHPFEDCVQREEMGTETCYDFYFVLWIERDGTNTRRKALGTVWERMWDDAGPEEVDVVLA